MHRPRLEYLRIIFLNLLVCLILLEGVSLVYLRVIRKEDPGWVPTYLEFQWSNTYFPDHDPLGPHVIDTTYPWVVWHPHNSRYHQKLSCIDVMMQFNAEGTRGSLPDSSDDRNILFLGDSFTEGWGLPETSTIATVVSNRLGRPALNLGVSGHVGTTQHSMIYDHFAARYRHGRLYVFLYLANDMIENDIRLYDHWFKANRRYRPYRADTSDLSSIVYKGALDSSLFNWPSYRRQRASKDRLLVRRYGLLPFLKDGPGSLAARFYMLTYTSRLIHILKDGVKTAVTDARPEELKYDAWSLRILSHDLGKIMETADRQRVDVVFTNIPSTRMCEEGARDTSMHARYLQLEQHVRKTVSKGRHRYLSFYDYIRRKKLVPSELVFTCDGHLNEVGTGHLADMVLQDGTR